MPEEIPNSVMIYEIKGQNSTDPGQQNYRSLLSADRQYFYWNQRKFVNLQIGDVVFVVNKTGNEVLHAELDATEIPTEYESSKDKTTFSDLDQTYMVQGKWDPFVRLKVVKAIKAPSDWTWKTLGSSENTYLLGDHVSANSAANNVERVNLLMSLPGHDEHGRELLRKCVLQLQESHKPSNNPRTENISDLFDILKRYGDENILFHSTARKATYSITEYEPDKFQVNRLDANEPVKINPSTYGQKIKSLAKHDGILPFSGFASPVALKNSLIQSRSLALSPDRKNVLDVSDPHKRLTLFCEIVNNLHVSSTSDGPKLYKPAMLACVIEAIDEGELTKNEIKFDFIAPLFIQKMKSLGVQTTPENAAQPFYHLTNDLIWLHAVYDVQDRMREGRDGPAAARNKVKYALLKDTFWECLKTEENRKTIMDALNKKWFGGSNTPNFWIEKSHVAKRPDRLNGDHALGKALWSPQKASGNRDIYSAMRDVKTGDIILHLVDNDSICGVSIAESSYDDSFQGIEGTDWEGPGYRIQLKDYEPLTQKIHRDEFFKNEQYKDALLAIRNTHTGLFYNKDLTLNQGSYLTASPPELVELFNLIYFAKTGKDLPHCSDILKKLIKNKHSNLDTFQMDKLPENIIKYPLVQCGLTKPFTILTGASGTGKTKLAESLAGHYRNRSDVSKATNVSIVPVGADWTDNRNVLGFVNHLRDTGPEGAKQPIYQSTPVLDLLLEAIQPSSNSTPHFLILDEMNLSHVERYFADFLSTMEQTDGKLYLHDEGPDRDDTFTLSRFEGDHTGVPRSISYPDNLYIIGTVNIDETTYMFSPKVLDRANVIEFKVEHQDISNFLDSPGNYPETEQAAKGAAEAFHHLGLQARHGDLNALPEPVQEEVQKHLLELFDIMQEGRFEFAYRTAKEVMRYMSVCRHLAADKDAWDNNTDNKGWKSDLDDQVLQKILPKLHGSIGRVGPLLANLADYCHQGKPAEEGKSKALKEFIDLKPDDSGFKKSYSKLRSMSQTLIDEQFVSFIQ